MAKAKPAAALARKAVFEIPVPTWLSDMLLHVIEMESIVISLNIALDRRFSIHLCSFSKIKSRRRLYFGADPDVFLIQLQSTTSVTQSATYRIVAMIPLCQSQF